MENSRSKTINEIAQEIDCGNDCYYNHKTGEIVTIPNFSDSIDQEYFEEMFESEIKKVTENKADYIKFEPLASFESFKIMERFVNEVTDQRFKVELENSLQNRKPFQNFKLLIDNSEYRQNWFDFKNTEIESIVDDHLNQSGY